MDKVDDESLERCQSNDRAGQCSKRKVPGSDYCVYHCGHKMVESKSKASHRMYRIAKWQERMSEFAEDENVKSLREEIGILRIVLEEMMNMCQDGKELLLYASRITDTVQKLEKLIMSCHRLEAATGSTLDKSQVLHLAAVIVEIIGEYVVDEDVVDCIGNKIVLAVASVKTEAAA